MRIVRRLVGGQALLGARGFVLAFCALKSVSLIRALETGGVIAKAIAEARTTALDLAVQLRLGIGRKALCCSANRWWGHRRSGRCRYRGFRKEAARGLSSCES